MLDRFPEAWKAIIAFLAPGAAMIITAITETSSGGESITAGEWVGALATAVVIGGTVYAVPNRVKASTLAAQVAYQDRTAPEVVHPSDIGAHDAGSYAQHLNRPPATFPRLTDDQIADREGIARYGDEPLPPASGQSVAATAAPETGSEKNYVDAPEWDEVTFHGVEVAEVTAPAGQEAAVGIDSSGAPVYAEDAFVEWLVTLQDSSGENHEVEVEAEDSQDAEATARNTLRKWDVPLPHTLVTVVRKAAPKHEKE